LTVEFSVEDGLEAEAEAIWDQVRLRALVASIVSRELPDLPSYVLGVHLVGDETMRALNHEHRAIDSVTDVLSFPLWSTEFVVPPNERVHLGDVAVCFSRAVQQAHDYGHSVERETAYLVAHGVLHILGYDHERPAEFEVMRSKEEEALQPLGFTR
jgi:probable rRNA maturation factor